MSLQQGFNIKVLQVKNEVDRNNLQQSNELDFILFSSLEEKLFDKTVSSDDASVILPSFNWNPLNELKKLNQSFQVIGFSCPPYVIIDDDNLTGLDVELIKLILLNWPIHFRILKGITNPYKNMEAILRNRTADMSSCGAWLTMKLFVSKSGLTPTYTEQCFTFLVHKPNRLPEATFMFQCFQLSLWFFISCSICFLVVYITIIQRFSSGKKIGMEESFILILNRLVGNSFEEEYTSRSRVLKYILLLWRVCSFLIMTYYSAGLPPYYNDLQINSVNDMVKMNIHWLERQSDNLKAYVRSFGGIYEAIADLFIFEKNTTVINMKIRNGKFAIPVESLPGRGLGYHEFLDEYGKEHMKVLPECLMKLHSVYVMQTNSPFQHFISRKILEVISHGFLEILFKKTVDKKHKKTVEGYYSIYIGELNNLLSLSKIQGGFWFILFGWILGLVCLINEKNRK
ncbi:hypothetical protein HHI36_014150 [Cryptolaemus montrouzieri]|uniref:Uncharacterized protein n=1 Tax=Cryptolaemus montrouzieri TaxID=559131 RepID=A0ABD2N1Y3_9CUCU